MRLSSKAARTGVEGEPAWPVLWSASEVEVHEGPSDSKDHETYDGPDTHRSDLPPPPHHVAGFTVGL